MRITVRGDTGPSKPKVIEARDHAHESAASQVLRHSNRAAPMHTGHVINSSLRSSQPGRGRLVWDTPYARRLYYPPQYNFSHEKAPHAGGLWFERAKST